MERQQEIEATEMKSVLWVTVELNIFSLNGKPTTNIDASGANTYMTPEFTSGPS